LINRPVTLIGDGVENPWNARTMRDAADMFGTACIFRDHGRLAASWRETMATTDGIPLVSRDDAARDFAPVIAFDNLDGAESVYGFRLPIGERPAVIVGNERRGIAREMQSIASHAVQIPLVSRSLNSLNVAAASAVALYYLTQSGGKQPTYAEPYKRRPELLIIGGSDHIELGSAIRSAGAFGWQRVFVEDRDHVWFGADRATRSEGRAASRRARNPIRLIPTTWEEPFAFREVCVITRERVGVPLRRANLAAGHGQMIVLADESRVDTAREDWQRLGKTISFVHVDVPSDAYTYHFRLLATIALAEIARQVGQAMRPRIGGTRRAGPRYDQSLTVLANERGETVFLDDLEAY